MDLDEEDPLLLFTGGRADACLGEWKNDRLQVLIRLADGRLVLESGKKELVLTEVGAYEWSVADSATPESPVYTCRVLGFGRETRLTLEPPKHKGGNFKATLRRVEHIGLPEVDPPPIVAITDGSAVGGSGAGGGSDAPRERTVENRDRAWERPRGGERDRSRSHSRSRSRSASRDSARSRGGGGRRRVPPGGGGGGGGRGRSRSPCRRRSPRRDAGKDGDEIVTTLFVTGLPGDAREEEVRQDCEWIGTVVRVVLMRRGSERNAFVRYGSLPDARKAMDKILDGEMQVCQTRVKAEMARRNTN